MLNAPVTRKTLMSSMTLLSLAATLATTLSPAFADPLRDDLSSMFRHPVAKQAAIGAGVGAATGILTRESSGWRGAGVGALTGVGTGLLDTSATLRHKPLLRTSLKGAVIGTGASTITNRGKLSGAAVGAGAGAGFHLLRDYLNATDDRRRW